MNDTTLLKDFLSAFPKNFAACFGWRNILWYALAATLTYGLVVTGFDGWYSEATRRFFPYAIPAALLGFAVPVFLPVVLYFFGARRARPDLIRAAFAVAEAALLGLLVSFVFKVFTGRAHPILFGAPAGADLSRIFHFGFLNGGVFWGWPSSHTTVAFAVAVTLLILFRKQRAVQIFAVLFALYVGLGVSMTIHWFSDFMAGAIMGSVVGVAVARGFTTDNGNGF